MEEEKLILKKGLVKPLYVGKDKIKFKVKEYVVVYDKKKKEFSCTCLGYKYHGKCKHISAVKLFFDIIGFRY